MPPKSRQRLPRTLPQLRNMALRKPIDLTRVIELASKGYTLNEIAAFENISHDTLTRRAAEAIKKGHQLRNGQLRAKQYERAMAGSDTMLIWLGKQLLDQRDRSETEITGRLHLAEWIGEARERVKRTPDSTAVQ